ncbi:hypothetical protein E2C01_010523 [Portunus trituberculatus]|uniref:Uncharacterized protein n=1 Tax=Portunus trituberculatus TaxID=210409 RepID=A0A5B7D8N8_PORTR|nr:hypothetical protein [Portunus trituberculatus]
MLAVPLPGSDGFPGTSMQGPPQTNSSSSSDLRSSTSVNITINREHQLRGTKHQINDVSYKGTSSSCFKRSKSISRRCDSFILSVLILSLRLRSTSLCVTLRFSSRVELLSRGFMTLSEARGARLRDVTRCYECQSGLRGLSRGAIGLRAGQKTGDCARHSPLWKAVHAPIGTKSITSTLQGKPATRTVDIPEFSVSVRRAKLGARIGDAESLTVESSKASRWARDTLSSSHSQSLSPLVTEKMCKRLILEQVG